MSVVNKDRTLSHNHIRAVGRDRFEDAMTHIRVGRGFITPEILLLQLQFASINPETIRRHIMEFDTESIGKGLDALISRGLQ